MVPSLDHHDTHLDFPDLPPFPTDVPTAPLLRIHLGRLLAGDAHEDAALWRACRDFGFFYLDLRNDDDDANGTPTSAKAVDGESLLTDAAQLFELAREVFALPEAEKQKYDFKDRGSYFGYKGLGQGVVDARGTRDRNEFWNLSKDDVLGVGGQEGQVPSPEVLRKRGNREVVGRFVRRSHAVVTVVLERLNARLGLREGTLEGLHRLGAVSGDQVRWVRSPPQPMDDRQQALGEHTDFGSVTVLFNQLGGLQVLPPDSEQWAYVRPLKGHCVVNMGDAMVKFTAGILRSNLHRVVNPPGEQGDRTRFSLVYFSRPEDEVVLRPLSGSEMIDQKIKEDPSQAEGEEISAKEWILKRALGRRVGGDWRSSEGTDKERLSASQKRDSGISAS